MESKTRKRCIALLIIMAILACGTLIATRLFWKKEQTAYITAPVARTDIEAKVLATGTLNAFKTVAVGAQVSGQVKTLHAALGERVKKGQLLAEIDPVLQQNSLRDAEASLENVQAQKRSKQVLLRQYQLALTRQEKMATLDASARADLESAQAQLESTRADLAALDAQIKKAKVSVDTARANLGYTRIVAPMDGIVIAIVTEEGQTVNANQTAPTILKLAELGTITVKAQISEADVIRVKPGLPVYFTVLGDPDKRYESRLRAIEPAPESESSSSTTSTSSSSSTAIYYNGLFEVPNPDHTLRVSMTAQVSIVLNREQKTLSIPVSALGDKDKDGRYRVRVLQGDQAVQRPIRTGITDNVQIQVLEGLKEGEMVIIGDSASLPASQTTNHGPPPRRN